MKKKLTRRLQENTNNLENKAVLFFSSFSFFSSCNSSVNITQSVLYFSLPPLQILSPTHTFTRLLVVTPLNHKKYFVLEVSTPYTSYFIYFSRLLTRQAKTQDCHSLLFLLVLLD